MSESMLTFDSDELLHRYDPEFAMAYGSGVFRQDGYSADAAPMIDIVMAVDDTLVWHSSNLRANPTDYSRFVRLMGPRWRSVLHNLAAWYSVCFCW